MKTPSKAFVETSKTVVITILITAIAAFIFGMKYQAHVSSQIKSEAKSIVSLKSKP